MSSDSNSNKKSYQIAKDIKGQSSVAINTNENQKGELKKKSNTTNNITNNKSVNNNSSKSINKEVKKTEYGLRKSAHVIEYFILGILLYLSFSLFITNKREVVLVVLLICLVITNLDEFYQSFIPNRHSSVMDSLIDFFGATIGVFISNYLKIRKRIEYNKYSLSNFIYRICSKSKVNRDKR